MNFVFKNKKYLFLDNISNMCTFAYFFLFILFQIILSVCLFLLSFNLIKNLNKKLLNTIG